MRDASSVGNAIGGSVGSSMMGATSSFGNANAISACASGRLKPVDCYVVELTRGSVTSNIYEGNAFPWILLVSKII